MVTKVKKTPKKRTPKSEVRIVLDGAIYVEEFIGEKVLSKDEIDGQAVLGLIIAAIEHSLNDLDRKSKRKAKAK